MSWSFRFRKRSEMPEGLWMRCDGCTKLVFKQTVVEQHNVCPECGHHFRLGAADRVALLELVILPFAVAADRVVDADFVSGLAAEQVIDRLIKRLTHDIPQSDIDS